MKLINKIIYLSTFLLCLIPNVALADSTYNYQLERGIYILLYGIPVGIIGLIIQILCFGKSKNTNNTEDDEKEV